MGAGQNSAPALVIQRLADRDLAAELVKWPSKRFYAQARGGILLAVSCPICR